MTNAVLTAALSYLERCRRVLPVLPDKTPALDLIEHTRGTRLWRSLRDEPADAAEVESWFDLDPAAGVGVICGNGLVVVDVDEPDHPDVPELPRTAVVSTPSGGRHHYFRTDDDVRGRTFEWGEVRAHGLYVVAPVSTGVNGRRYEWTTSDDVELAELPEALRKRARAKNGSAPPEYLFSLGLSVLSRESLERLDAHEEVVRRLLGPLGVPQDVPLGRGFHCVLHDDVRPSATLQRAENGTILYHCFAACGPGRSAWFPLAEVRARQAGRRSFRLGRVELALWKLDLLERAGLIEPVALASPTAPAHLDLVWNGFLRLLGLRWLSTPGRPTPFARAFAGPWCSLGEHEFRAGFDELRRLGLVRYAGTDPRGLALWLPCEGVRPIA